MSTVHRPGARLCRRATWTGVRPWLALLCLLLGFGSSPSVWAHKPSDSYLVIDAQQGSHLEVRWDIALRDLNYAVGLDANNDGRITWGEVRAQFTAVDQYATARLTLAVDGHACHLVPWQHRADSHSDGVYLVTDFHTDCPAHGTQLSTRYRLFADLDPMHRGLLRLVGAAGTRTAVLGGEHPERSFVLDQPGMFTQIREYAVHGVWHIWQGIDHILFLLSLLLPSVLLRRPTPTGDRLSGWVGATRLRSTLLDILRVVTAFTIAHSITLSLAALGLVMLPSRLVESTIAASVLLAALNNLYPMVGEGRWAVAFLFGLIHGFGFASVLADLDLPRDALAGALVGFNLGVEAGQMVIVLAFIPLAWPLRNTRFYRLGVLGIGSVLVAVLAAIWLVERAFDLKILPFTV